LQSAEVLKDFPEIADDVEVAGSLLDEIWQQSRVTYSDARALVTKNNLIPGERPSLESRMDALQHISLWLCIAYEEHLPRKEGLLDKSGYDKEKVLEKAIKIVAKTLRGAVESLKNLSDRILRESFNLALAASGDFDTDVPETRRWLEPQFRIKAKTGPKPKSLREDVQTNYEVLIGDLRKTPQVQAYGNTVRRYKESLRLRYEVSIENMVDQIHKKKPKRAAIFLLAQMYNRSERQIENYLK